VGATFTNRIEKKMKRFGYVIFFCLLLAACSDSDHLAPVTDISATESIPRTGIHRVMRKETLYAIVWRYGLDYRYLALLNHIQAPYTIHTHQLIYLQSNHPAALKKTEPNMSYVAAQQMPKKIAAASQPIAEPNYTMSHWIKPAQGKVINYFSLANKGINIAGLLGDPIYAACAGKVVYAGDGLRAYGNLIIIKHNSLFLSAYAHNFRIFVKEGDWVKQGQKIAEMGKTGAHNVMLHFEIRRAGKPMDPMVLFR
jgi:lipoprotein NlpD